MEVDAEGYTPVYEDLASYRLPDASAPSPSSADAGQPEEKPNTPPPIRAMRPLAAFMTPQASRTGFGGAANGVAGMGGAPVPRYSLGGAAQRVRVEDSPWKVRDLLATNAHAHAPGAGVRAANDTTNPFANNPSSNVPGTPARRPPLSEAERRAISERRRSALKAPDDFFKGAIPGMSPAKKGAGSVLRRVNEDAGDVSASVEVVGGGQKDKEREDDPRRMLENLRETVEGLKRRRESVLADAGRAALLPESDAEEERVEFQLQTEVRENEEEQQKSEKERPRTRMLRGRAREVGFCSFRVMSRITDM